MNVSKNIIDLEPLDIAILVRNVDINQEIGKEKGNGALIKRGQVWKGESTKELLGCTGEELKNYLISKLPIGYTWQDVESHNVEIDHILPCFIFNLKLSEERKRCFYYTNLIPLTLEQHKQKTSEDYKKYYYSQFNRKLNTCKHHFDFSI